MTQLWTYAYSDQTALNQSQQRQLLKVFWLIALSLLVYEIFWTRTDSLLTNVSAALITVAALLPGYLWCAGKAYGMPIFPLFTFTFIWTYALPLVTEHPKVVTYADTDHLSVAAMVASSLGVGTFIWFRFVNTAPQPAPIYRALGDRKGESFFLLIIALGVLFNVTLQNGIIGLLLSGGFFTAARAAVLALNALASFVLAYRLGTQTLSRSKARLFIGLLVAYMVSSAVSLLLIGAASTFMVATAGFVIGRRRIPFVPITIALILLSLLHYGKGEMRSKYWFQGNRQPVQVWNYPARYGEWIGYTFNYFSSQNEFSTSSNKQSFLERSSLVHLLLLAHDKSPQIVPYLNGKTYTILPQLLVPRALNPNKIRSHEGTYILNIHYGLQTQDQTQTTTIGWGLFAEAFANFGFLGCLGLAGVLGSLYGAITRWSINMPIVSDRALVAVLMLTFAFQTEWSAGVYVAAFFQSSIILGGIIVFLMKPHRASPAFSDYIG